MVFVGDISIVNGIINQLITWGAPPFMNQLTEIWIRFNRNWAVEIYEVATNPWCGFEFVGSKWSGDSLFLLVDSYQ